VAGLPEHNRLMTESSYPQLRSELPAGTRCARENLVKRNPQKSS
jgi:hypothetical protein